MWTERSEAAGSTRASFDVFSPPWHLWRPNNAFEVGSVRPIAEWLVGRLTAAAEICLFRFLNQVAISINNRDWSDATNRTIVAWCNRDFYGLGHGSPYR